MSAVTVLRQARAAGIELRVVGCDLVLEAEARPPPDLLENLKHHKPDIVALLRPGLDGWSAEDWLAFFDERAGIAEFDGGLARSEAEARAIECCVVEWLNRNFVASPPDRCLGCSEGEQADEKLQPIGTEQTGHAWLHARCWSAWRNSRKDEAIATLSTFGIDGMRTSP